MVPMQRRVRDMLETVAIGPERWGPNRLLSLTNGQAGLYLGILAKFGDGGTPAGAFLKALGAQQGVQCGDALAALEANDLLRRDKTGAIVRAQPFSAIPTRHRVQLIGRPAQFATCAIDAIAQPYMFSIAGLVRSIDPVSCRQVTLRIRPYRQPLAQPATAVAVIGRLRHSNRSVCESIHLFSSTASAQRFVAHAQWLVAHVLNLEEAVIASQVIFSGLLSSSGWPTQIAEHVSQHRPR